MCHDAKPETTKSRKSPFRQIAPFSKFVRFENLSRCFFLGGRRGLARVCRPCGTEGRPSARSASRESRGKARAPVGAGRAAQVETRPRVSSETPTLARMLTRRAVPRER